MKPIGFIRFTLPFLVLLFLGSCATSSQSTLENAPPEFRRFLGTWVKRSGGGKYEEVFYIKSISSTGKVDIDFEVERVDGYMEDRAFVHGDHVWIKISEATARIESKEPRIRLTFIPDRKYERFPWDSYDLTLFGIQDDFLAGIGTQSNRTYRVTFFRQ